MPDTVPDTGMHTEMLTRSEKRAGQGQRTSPFPKVTRPFTYVLGNKQEAQWATPEANVCAKATRDFLTSHPASSAMGIGRRAGEGQLRPGLQEYEGKWLGAVWSSIRRR